MTDALTLEPKTKFKNWHDRKPIKELDDRGLKMVEAMTFGVDEAEAAALGVAPYQPLPLEKAADASGLKRRNARWLYTQPVFLSAYSKALANVRSSHKARAVATMAAIMDDPGENLAADRTVRLKAAQALMGEEGKSGGPTVNLQINNGPTLMPGVVVRLPATAASPPLERMSEDGEIIEHDATPLIPAPNHSQSEKRTFDGEALEHIQRQHPHVRDGE